LPRAAKRPSAGRGWIHEIKLDGFHIMARRSNGNVQLLTHKDANFSNWFPQIVATLMALPVRSCFIDGEAVVCDENGLAVFDLICGYEHDAAAVLCAFDLIEVDGKDLRRAPIEEREAVLASLLKRNSFDGITFNEHHALDGAIVFRYACAMGCEGLVSKRLGSSYRSGGSDCWIKVQNSAAPAVRRQAEEELT